MAGCSYESHATSEEFEMSMLILPCRDWYCPDRVMQTQPTWSHIGNLALADPDYRAGDEIDLLPGATVYASAPMV